VTCCHSCAQEDVPRFWGTSVLPLEVENAENEAYLLELVTALNILEDQCVQFINYLIERKVGLLLEVVEAEE
jgi:hypothetical protein